MPHKDIELIPYESTIHDLLINQLKGKYFQSILNPQIIIEIPEDIYFNHLEDNQLSVWFPLKQKWGDISLKDFNRYAFIPKEQFEKYIRANQNLENVVLAHKDSPIFKENLSHPDSKL